MKFSAPVLVIHAAPTPPPQAWLDMLAGSDIELHRPFDDLPQGRDYRAALVVVRQTMTFEHYAKLDLWIATEVAPRLPVAMNPIYL